ncbi:MAG: hypothetical protein R2932_16020 [Caldilineaceae bacterium]
MTNQVPIILANTPLYQPLAELVQRQRIILFAGLPGVGKSLFLQQSALLAKRVGRTVHLLQWDVTRAAFETSTMLARYPEVNGITHAAIRKAVGLWTRAAIGHWHRDYADTQHLLIGEVPLIGNRLIELVQLLDDAVEPLLADAACTFVLPVPARHVRQAIEASRTRTTANPQHAKEAGDASPYVLQLLWAELYRIAGQLGIPLDDTGQAGVPPYDPKIYAAVYQRLLRHRNVLELSVDRLLSKVGSVYDLPLPIHELMATVAQVQETMAQVETLYDPATLEHAVAQWYQVAGRAASVRYPENEDFTPFPPPTDG